MYGCWPDESTTRLLLRDLTLRAALALAPEPHGFTVGDFAARGTTRWYAATIKAVVSSDNAAALA
jgi:hypothetical protein